MSEFNETGKPTPTQVGSNPYNSYGLATQGFVWAAISSVSGTFDGKVDSVNGIGPDSDGNVNVSSIFFEDYSGDRSEIRADLTALSGGEELRILTNIDYSALDSKIDSVSGDSSDKFSVIAAASGGWNNAQTEIESSSADWHNVETKVETTSAKWDSAYSSVKSTSGGWDNATFETESHSGNWNSAYSTVNGTSAEWVKYNYLESNYLPLSGGELDIENSETDVIGFHKDGNSPYVEIAKKTLDADDEYVVSDYTRIGKNGLERHGMGEIQFPSSSGTIALSSSFLSGYGITDVYTKDETDHAINSLAAYYITYDADGSAFPHTSSLRNAETVYSGGVVRIPTRNDYAVVLEDEDNDNDEWRYIYSVAPGESTGHWEAQYPIETNDYAALSDKPQINGNELIGNKTGRNLGLRNYSDLSVNDGSDSIALTSEMNLRLLSESIYPEWVDDGREYPKDSVVTHCGKIWRSLSNTRLEPSSENPAKWESITFEGISGRFVKIDEKGSVVVGSGNTSISERNVVVGYNNTAGLKGYRWSGITFGDNPYITLDRQTNGLTQQSIPLSKDDVISVINDAKYDNCATIKSITWTNDSVLIYTSSLPFTAVKPDSGYDSKMVFAYSKPSAGHFDLGMFATSEGLSSSALNLVAHSEGYGTLAYGQYSHAEGRETTAGYAAHAEGHNTHAIGERSHSEGGDTISDGNGAHSEGMHTASTGIASHAEGYSNTRVDYASFSSLSSLTAYWDSLGDEEKFTLASSTGSHAEGHNTLSLGLDTHSEGFKTIVVGNHAHVEGSGSKSLSGVGAHAEGVRTETWGDAAHAEGYETRAHFNYAHSEGQTTYATNRAAHAEGVGRNDRGASGIASHVEGVRTTASKQAAHAEGQETTASGTYAHSEGFWTTAQNQSEHAQGQYNKSNNGGIDFGNEKNTLHSIGFGQNANDRKNAIEVMQDGKTFVYGIGDYNGKNPTGQANAATDLATVITQHGDALRSGFTEWEFEGVPEGLAVVSLAYASSSSEWVLSLLPADTLFADGDEDDTSVVFSGSDYTITASRHLITPTKTSQLTNDSGFITAAQVPTPSYIEDADGNKIEAGLDCWVADLTTPWTLTNNSEVYTLTYNSDNADWEYIDGTNTKVTLRYYELEGAWDLVFFVWGGEETGWLPAGGYNVEAPYNATSLSFPEYWGATRTILSQKKIATMSDLPTKTSELTNDSGFITSADVHGDYIEDADGNRINANLTYSSRYWKCWRIDGTDNILTGEKVLANNLYKYPQPEEGDEYYQISFDSQNSMWSLFQFGYSDGIWYTIRSDSVSGVIDDTSVLFAGWKTVVQENDSGTIVSNADLVAALANKKDKQSPVNTPTTSGNSTSFIDSISQDANGVITPTKKTIPTAAPSTSGAGGTAGLMSAADKEKLNGIADGATAVSVDTTLSRAGEAADANEVGVALDGKRGLKDLTVYDDETVFALSSGGGEIGVMVPSDDGWLLDLGSGDYWSLSYGDGLWTLGYDTEGAQGQYTTSENEDAATIRFDGGSYTATRSSVVSPTLDTLAKESQMPTASTATPQMDSGNGSAGGENTTTYSKSDHVHPSDTSKANAADLPYRLVTLTASRGAWTVSGLGEGWTYGEPEFSNGTWSVGITSPTYFGEATASGDAGDLSVSFSGEIDGESFSCTFSRLYANGASLLDRAVNAVPVTGAVTLTLPSLVTGKSRDFFLNMSVSGTQTVTFSGYSGENLTWHKTVPPSSFPEGSTVCRFTEIEQGKFVYQEIPVTVNASEIEEILKSKRGLTDLSSYTASYDPTGDWHDSDGNAWAYDSAFIDQTVQKHGGWVRSTGGYAFNYSEGQWILYYENNSEWYPTDSFTENENIGEIAFSFYLPNVTISRSPTGYEPGTDTIAFVSQIPTNNNQLTNGSGFITASYLTNVASASSGWSSVYSSVNSASGGWNDAKTEIESSSADWNNVGTKVESASANWDSAYTTTNTNSSNWTSVYSSVNSASGNWDSVYTSTNSSSSNWDSVYSSVNSASSGWDKVSEKMDSTAVATAFSSASTYYFGDYVTYEGQVYRFKATHTANTAWDDTEVDRITLTSPDATLDLGPGGELKVVDEDGNTLWQQGYNLKSQSSLNLTNESVNVYTFIENASNPVTVLFPSVVDGKVSDFILDVSNPSLNSSGSGYPSSTFSPLSTYAAGEKVLYEGKAWSCSVAVTAAGPWTSFENWETSQISFGSALDNTISVVVPKGDVLSDMLIVEPGEMCEYYFTLTGFRINGKPTFKVVKQVVENGGAD